jgi:hypothetical protein
MGKVIIQNKSSEHDLIALRLVGEVIKMGRMSGQGYCSATVFEHTFFDVMSHDVAVRATRNKMSDRFVVFDAVTEEES